MVYIILYRKEYTVLFVLFFMNYRIVRAPEFFEKLRTVVVPEAVYRDMKIRQELHEESLKSDFPTGPFSPPVEPCPRG